MKLVLDQKELTICFFEDSRLLGIMAPVKDYQFCWNLNNLMGMDFRINNEIEIQVKRKKRDYFFSVFEFPVPSTSLPYYLYNNKYDGQYLLPEFKQLDFLWLLLGENVPDKSLDELVSSLREINGVPLVAGL